MSDVKTKPITPQDCVDLGIPKHMVELAARVALVMLRNGYRAMKAIEKLEKENG